MFTFILESLSEMFYPILWQNLNNFSSYPILKHTLLNYITYLCWANILATGASINPLQIFTYVLKYSCSIVKQDPNRIPMYSGYLFPFVFWVWLLDILTEVLPCFHECFWEYAGIVTYNSSTQLIHILTFHNLSNLCSLQNTVK